MSDIYICLIPRDPEFLPSAAGIAAAEEFMAYLAPDADQIESEIAPHIKFRDCGASLESVRCPVCDADILDWWRDLMGDGEHWDEPFVLEPVALPCGHVAPSLNELRYTWDQGFSRFMLEAMNPAIGPLDEEELKRFEELLGCPLKAIYQHV